METILVSGLHSNCTVITGEHLSNVMLYLPHKQVFIITDDNLVIHHALQFPDFPVFSMSPGEQSKTPETALRIYRWLLEQGADRQAFILAIGGGIVCDMAGYVASTFVRGVDFGFVASSLLAQVDASVGGKNGVNLDGHKNMIGTFNQPRFVLCDTSLLKTLPEEELRNGMAEVIKHALIADKKLFEEVESNIESIMALNQERIQHIISRSVQIKSGIVNEDERENGVRRKLNLGHTLGHAIEKTTGISHGQAISTGMAFAAALSHKKGLLTEQHRQRITRLLQRTGLPVSSEASPEKVFEVLVKDKKKQEDSIHFVLLKEIGEAVVTPVPLGELREFGVTWMKAARRE